MDESNRSGDEELQNLSQARTIIARWVQHYNDDRLHAGLGYLPPAEFYRGDPAARVEERRVKLEKARTERRRINDERRDQERAA
jgi:hypothetical protein